MSGAPVRPLWTRVALGMPTNFLGRAGPKMRSGGRDYIFSVGALKNRFGRLNGGATRDDLTRCHMSPTLTISLLFLSRRSYFLRSFQLRLSEADPCVVMAPFWTQKAGCWAATRLQVRHFFLISFYFYFLFLFFSFSVCFLLIYCVPFFPINLNLDFHKQHMVSIVYLDGNKSKKL
jgi:hypothetical protein